MKTMKIMFKGKGRDFMDYIGLLCLRGPNLCRLSIEFESETKEVTLSLN